MEKSGNEEPDKKGKEKNNERFEAQDWNGTDHEDFNTTNYAVVDTRYEKAVAHFIYDSNIESIMSQKQQKMWNRKHLTKQVRWQTN